MHRPRINESHNETLLEGFCIDLLKAIAEMVGFEYRLTLVPDGKYGVYNYQTGEWNGMVKQLIDRVGPFIFKVKKKKKFPLERETSIFGK